MSIYSRFKEKIDVLDLIIDVLRDHEEALSKIIEKFDEICQKMSIFNEKMDMLNRVLEQMNGLRVKTVVKADGINGPLVRIKCNDWITFKTASQGALLAVFTVSEDGVTISSVTDLFIFSYCDEIPEFMSIVSRNEKNVAEKNLTVWSRRFSSDDGYAYNIISNPEALRSWLSSELKLPCDKIIYGGIIG